MNLDTAQLGRLHHSSIMHHFPYYSPNCHSPKFCSIRENDADDAVMQLPVSGLGGAALS
ncbi:hypothetical protein [Steroidobacter denitrificans]|uniref:hypothetical protein n=1 Tax=Steroidobacter denitrificans TaxID=465721 RepID=UPI0012EDB022|nr:hypothetical protein [Steroidobacter denitrificans]